MARLQSRRSCRVEFRGGPSPRDDQEKGDVGDQIQGIYCACIEGGASVFDRERQDRPSGDAQGIGLEKAQEKGTSSRGLAGLSGNNRVLRFDGRHFMKGPSHGWTRNRADAGDSRSPGRLRQHPTIPVLPRRAQHSYDLDEVTARLRQELEAGAGRAAAQETLYKHGRTTVAACFFLYISCASAASPHAKAS